MIFYFIFFFTFLMLTERLSGLLFGPALLLLPLPDGSAVEGGLQGVLRDEVVLSVTLQFEAMLLFSLK